MPRRHQVIATNEIYHVFNRTVGNEDAFNHKHHFHRAFDLIDYYRFPQSTRYSKFRKLSVREKMDYYEKMLKKPPLVEIYAFALMPDHFHFLLKQIQDKGISKFVSFFQNSSAKYFNLRNKRHGALFVNPFKAKRVATDEEFMHVSRYIHLNPVTSFLINLNQVTTDSRTSLPYYLQPIEKSLINTDEIIGMFESKEKYLDFINNQADYQRKLHLIKKLLIERY